MPHLAFKFNGGNERSFDLLGARFSIGRGSGNAIVIDNLFISGLHAEFLRREDGSYEVIDLNSANGTFVNGERIDRARVKAGDRIMFGQLEGFLKERVLEEGGVPDTGSKVVADRRNRRDHEDGKTGHVGILPKREQIRVPNLHQAADRMNVSRRFVPESATEHLTALEGQIARAEARLGEITRLASECSSKAQGLEVRLEARVAELAKIESALANQQSVLELKSEATKAREATLAQLAAEADAACDNLAALNRQIGQIAGAEARLGEILQIESARRREVQSLESRFEARAAELAKVEFALASQQSVLAETEVKTKACEATLAQLAAQESATSQKLADIWKQVTLAGDEVNRLNALQAEARNVEAEQRKRYSDEARHLKQQLNELRTESTKVDSQCVEKSAELATVIAAWELAQVAFREVQTRIALHHDEERAISTRIQQMHGANDGHSSSIQSREQVAGLVEQRLAALGTPPRHSVKPQERKPPSLQVGSVSSLVKEDDFSASRWWDGPQDRSLLRFLHMALTRGLAVVLVVVVAFGVWTYLAKSEKDREVPRTEAVAFLEPIQSTTTETHAAIPPVTEKGIPEPQAESAGREPAKLEMPDETVVESELVRLEVAPAVIGDVLDGSKDATPHQVSLSPFMIARHEVTLEVWERVRGWGLDHGYAAIPPGRGKMQNHPVYAVVWAEAVKWCNARSEMEGFMPCYYADHHKESVFRQGAAELTNRCVQWEANGYRLPTEAEWEVAARGGQVGKRFPWGNEITHQDANYSSAADSPYDKSSARGPPAPFVGSLPYTSPVGSFRPNDFGLYDMSGNVSEWCWDVYDKFYGIPQLGETASGVMCLPLSAVQDPKGPDFGPSSVVRGGSWRHGADDARCANRFDLPQMTSSPSPHVGFRVVRRP